MESYEEFCSSSLARLQTEGKWKMCYEASSPQGAFSLIQFHGRAVLPPVMSEEQRWEMAQYRQRAAQLDAERQSLRSTSLLARVQAILDTVQESGCAQYHTQVCKVPEKEERAPTPPTCCSPRPECQNGFALLPNTAGPTWGESGCAGDAAVAPERETTVLLNGMRGDGAEEWGEAEEEVGVSLQSLLKRSREYLEREQGRGSQGSCVAAPSNALRESLSDTENKSGGGQPCHQPNHSPLIPDRGHPGSDPNGSNNPLPCSLTGSYARLPNPEPSLSPRPHRRRPRPVSAGNIYNISFPVCTAEQERGALAGWGPSEKSSPDYSSPTDSLSPTGAGVRRGSHSGAGVGGETVGLVGACVCAPTGQDSMAPGFRRRSQTLDSQLYPCHSGPPVDRSQERVPRFMGGLPWRAPCRRSPPAPLNQSYDVESPAPALLRPQVVRSPTPSHIKHSVDVEGQLTLDLLTSPLEQQDNKTREAQWEVQALETMQKQLEEEHALQLSLLIAEQEREHQHLQQELEEREKRLRDQGGKRATAGDLGADWQAQRDSCPTLSPASPASPALSLAGRTLSPAERSPGPIRSMGFPSLLSPSAPSPALQPPVYLWGPSWGTSKMRGRLSQVLTPELHAALCRLGAVARGFLTRRLLMTEKVKHLRQTVQDTQEFIRSFQTEGPLRKSSVSAQDLSLQERVRAQLRAALFDVHDIFFEMPLEERLTLLQQDRELRLERKLREMEKAKSPRDRVSLSAATQKSLDRKKQRVVGSPGQAKRMQHKPKSPPSNRVLQPSQGQNSPVPGQLLRQGSLYRKGPEERVKHSNSLRKQHSLG